MFQVQPRCNKHWLSFSDFPSGHLPNILPNTRPIFFPNKTMDNISYYITMVFAIERNLLIYNVQCTALFFAATKRNVSCTSLLCTLLQCIAIGPKWTSRVGHSTILRGAMMHCTLMNQRKLSTSQCIAIGAKWTSRVGRMHSLQREDIWQDWRT